MDTSITMGGGFCGGWMRCCGVNQLNANINYLGLQNSLNKTCRVLHWGRVMCLQQTVVEVGGEIKVLKYEVNSQERVKIGTTLGHLKTFYR